jgi:hypothetical protein
VIKPIREVIMKGDDRHTRASYIEDDCKINAGIREKERILKKMDEIEYMLHDDHMPRHLRQAQETPGGSTPSQYQLPDNATDLQDLIEYRHMNFAMGNIFKACYRSGNCNHSDLLRDVNKILWFAEREKKRLTRDNQV